MLPRFRTATQRGRGNSQGSGQVVGMHPLGPRGVITLGHGRDLLGVAAEKGPGVPGPRHALLRQIPIPYQVLGGASGEMKSVSGQVDALRSGAS